MRELKFGLQCHIQTCSLLPLPLDDLRSETRLGSVRSIDGSTSHFQNKRSHDSLSRHELKATASALRVDLTTRAILREDHAIGHTTLGWLSRILLSVAKMIWPCLDDSSRHVANEASENAQNVRVFNGRWNNIQAYWVCLCFMQYAVQSEHVFNPSLLSPLTEPRLS